jgi:hypothetical protein
MADEIKNEEKDEGKKAPRVALCLLHYPILDSKKQVVATNITNFDIHDIARAATVYGVEKYYIIHPIPEQLMFVERVLDHWRTGKGAKFNPHRRRALNDVYPVKDLEEAAKDFGHPPDKTLFIGTHARPVGGARAYSIQEIRKRLEEPEMALFLLFGTGFGMTDEFMQKMDGVLEPIRGAPPKDFRHLSVRSAVSIYLDRILGPW